VTHPARAHVVKIGVGAALGRNPLLAIAFAIMAAASALSEQCVVRGLALGFAGIVVVDAVVPRRHIERVSTYSGLLLGV
jgi:hypothetical protein